MRLPRHLAQRLLAVRAAGAPESLVGHALTWPSAGPFTSSMIELPARRISGLPLRLLVKAVHRSPLGQVVVQAFRVQLGIEAVLSLGKDLRGPLPVNILPLRARAQHVRLSQQLGIPEPAAWPNASSAYARSYRDGRLRPEQVVDRAFTLSRE